MSIKCPVCKQVVPNWRSVPPNLLQIVLDVHMTTTGSFERPRRDQAKDLGVLEGKLINWTYLSKRTETFDEAVRKLLQVVVLEAREKIIG